MKIMSANEMSVLSGGKTKKCTNCGKTYKTKFTYTYHGVWNLNSQCIVTANTNKW